MSEPPAEQVLLNELEALLGAQLADAVAGNPESAAERMPRASRLLSDLQARGPLSPAGADQLRRIDRLRRDLVLALTQQRAEAARGLAQARGGRNMLKAYGR